MEAHEKGFFTEEDSVEVVIGRNARAKATPERSHGGDRPQAA